jgi:FMN phosphatase YigB (HAD superfamily)
MFDVVFFDLGDTLVHAKDPSQWRTGARDAIERVHSAGAQIGLLSNTGTLDRQGLRPLLPPDFPWTYLNDRLIVLSGEHPWAKPDPEIFRFAIAQTGLSGHRSLYCSEDLAETVAAEQAGMRSVRLSSDNFAELIAIVAPPVPEHPDAARFT